MTVMDEIAAERRRQTTVEGWTPEHDDAHEDGDLAAAGAIYAIHGASNDRAREGYPEGEPRLGWPFDRASWKPKDRRRDLIRAAALIAAEIERMDRAEQRANPMPDTFAEQPGGAR
ncbi:hypothetical protein [uncultured Alsobacter sp.]|uniref:hypothetical protein n=1 Tax=uncultured Alsobacter sp. TaxID=1748258 RepID=UPI0025E7B289|nr:hypothetical protein [uncultured Alsobacter sp.]